MKAITIHAPYSHLIVTPQSELPDGAVMKRVENRTWDTSVRGDIAIHAGVSFDWFKNGDWPNVPAVPPSKLKRSHFPEMAFGAIVGVADLADVFTIEQVKAGHIPSRFIWLQSHVHAEGPYCFVFSKVRRLTKPVTCVGKQGFWNVPEDVLARINKRLPAPVQPIVKE